MMRSHSVLILRIDALAWASMLMRTNVRGSANSAILNGSMPHVSGAPGWLGCCVWVHVLRAHMSTRANEYSSRACESFARRMRDSVRLLRSILSNCWNIRLSAGVMFDAMLASSPRSHVLKLSNSASVRNQKPTVCGWKVQPRDTNRRSVPALPARTSLAVGITSLCAVYRAFFGSGSLQRAAA